MDNVRLIDANALGFRFDALCAGECSCCQCHDSDAPGHGCKLISSAPTIDAAPVVHGRWERCFEDWRHQLEGDKCSACGFEHYGMAIDHYLYCPNCGARMDAKEEKPCE